MSRIPEVRSDAGLTGEQREAWDAILASRGVVRGPFPVLLHRPELARRTADLGAVVRFASRLDPRVRALACLITARHFDCQFEWSSNEADARRAGVPDEAMSAIRDRSAPAELGDEDRLVFTFVQELLATNRVSDITFDMALNRFGVGDLVELVAFVGYYANLAMILNAFQVETAPYFRDLLPT